MYYTLHDHDGQPIAGEERPNPSREMMARADDVQGHITDSAGTVVYPTEA